MINNKIRSVTWAILAIGALNPQGFCEEYPFGRVFTTQSQRQVLDSEAGISACTSCSGPASETVGSDKSATENSREALTFSGLLIQSDGKTSAWIRSSDQGLRQKSFNSNSTSSANESAADLSMSVRNGEKTKRLKPGQVWYVNENSVKELYQANQKPIENLPLLPESELATSGTDAINPSLKSSSTEDKK